jgi:hypothetical protein
MSPIPSKEQDQPDARRARAEQAAQLMHQHVVEWMKRRAPEAAKAARPT